MTPSGNCRRWKPGRNTKIPDSLRLLWKAAGAAAWCAVGFDSLLPFLRPETKAAIETLCPRPGGVYVAAFPYYAGDAPGNLSLYCRGQDYHVVLRRRLAQVCRGLQAREPDGFFLPAADNSPLPELLCARLGGLGLCGRHGLLILPPYGSYVFLGTILTDRKLHSPAAPAPLCEDCGACRRACPTGALSEDGRVDAGRCLSALSQEKGDLPLWAQEKLAQAPLIWGCDLCQRACPHNRTPQETALPEFRAALRCSLGAAELEGLSNRAFQRQYGDCAFAWRGPAPLRRNLQLQEIQQKTPPK